MPELTEEDLLNLRVTGEKLLASSSESAETISGSPAQESILAANDKPVAVSTQEQEVHTATELDLTAKTGSVMHERPPPPYPSHLLPQKSDASGLSQQMLGTTVIDNKPPLPPPPAYGAHHHIETSSSSRIVNSNSAQREVAPREETSPPVTQVMQLEAVPPMQSTEIVYPWRVKKQQILSNRLLAKQQQLQNQRQSGLAEAPPPGRQTQHARVASDPLSEVTGHTPHVHIQAGGQTPTRPVPKRIYRYADYVDSGALSDSEMGMSTVYRRRRRDDALKPSLTFVGRRIESPAGSGASNGGPPNASLPAKTVFSHLIKPDSRMSPITERGSPLLFVSAPPSGLRKIPAQSSVDSEDEARRPPTPPQVVLSAPSPGPMDKPVSEQLETDDQSVGHQFQGPPAVQPQGQPVVLQGRPASYNQGQVVVSQSQPVVLQGRSVEPQPPAPNALTEIQPEAAESHSAPETLKDTETETATDQPDAPTSNGRSPQNDVGGEHSPRPEDIYFSAAAPDLVDIPMPQVKEMINDLNRRLEAIAAQQPGIAQPPTPQELGLSFERMKDLQQQTRIQEAQQLEMLSGATNKSTTKEEKEIFINSKPMPDSTLESLKQRLFGTDITTSATFQKIYDVTSPLTSPPPQRRAASATSEEERSPSPRSASRRVHFADPPAQSVIEIEPRNKLNRRDRKLVREPLSLVSVSTSLTPKKDSVGIGSQISRPDNLTVPLTPQPQPSQKPSSPLSETEVDSQIREEIYAKYSRLKSDIARETLLSPNRNPPSYVSSTVPGAYPSASPQNFPQRASPQGGSGINVSIVHQKADHTSPSRQYSFTLPQAQPGHPSHFRYTISARKPSDPVSFEYAFPPSYEESMRMRAVHQGQHKSLDDSFMTSSLFSSKPREMQYLQAPAASPLHTGASPPLSPRVRSRLYVDTASQGGGLSPTQQLLQRLSPQQQAAAAAVGLIQSAANTKQADPTQGAFHTTQTIRSSPVIQGTSMVMNYGHTKVPSQTEGTQGQAPNPPVPPPLPPRESPMLSGHHGPSAGLDLDFDLSQSKSFRNLQINFSDGGKMEIPIRLDHHFGSPQQGQDTFPFLCSGSASDHFTLLLCLVSCAFWATKYSTCGTVAGSSLCFFSLALPTSCRPIITHFGF